MRRIYSTLDIGSDTIKMVVGEFINNKLHILCAAEEISEGYRHNEITDKDKLILTIKKLIMQINEKLNFKVKKVILNISSTYNNFIVTSAQMSIKNEDHLVSSEDILKVIQLSTKNHINASEELICVEPIMFQVDDTETLEPFHKVGKYLGVKCVLITGDKKYVYDLLDILNSCDLNVVDITPSGLVDYYNFKTPEMDSNVGVLIDLGNTSTTINVINKGIFINTEVIDVGGYDIDKDIGFAYNLRRTEAKYLKENLALASLRTAEPRQTLKVMNREGKEIVINQYELTEIVANKLTEILKLTKNNINHLTKKEISYIIITGGLTEIKEFPIEIASIYGDNIKIGNINRIGARHNKYSIAIGMLLYFNDKLNLRNKEYTMISENDIEVMCNGEAKAIVATDSILGKVFGCFFDN